jgi:hypothetical protein
MKVGDGTYRGEPVPLPIEILDLVVQRIIQDHEFEAQQSLWACCLVSKDWYSTSVSELYARPNLTPRNFDLFARTICPPLKARKSRTGLENFIKLLDMRQIAYESSNSTTARLINRTRASLEGFVSPAVSFR